MRRNPSLFPILIGLTLAGAAGAGTQIDDELARLEAAAPGDGDRFGDAVAIDGTTAVVGAFNDDDAAVNGGLAFVFEKSGGPWVQTQVLTSSDVAQDDGFGVSVALEGDILFVGATGVGISEGAVYVFERIAGVWKEVQKLTPSDASFLKVFGKAIALDGDTALIGAPNDGDVANLSGAVYVFRKIGGVWTEVQKLKAQDAATFDAFGSAVGLDGGVAVISSPDDDSGVFGAGSAYVFEEQAGSFVQVAELFSSDLAIGDRFAESVAVQNGRIVAGAQGADFGTVTSAGAAYIFEKIGGVWTETQKIVASDATDFADFGDSVALLGDHVVVGAVRDDVSGGIATGSAYLFSRIDGVFVERLKLLPAAPGNLSRFGDFIAITEGFCLIGAPRETNAPGIDGGSAYVFDLRFLPFGVGCGPTAPLLRGEGEPAGGGTVTLTLSDAPANAFSVLFLGQQEQATSAGFGCDLLVGPQPGPIVVLTTDGSGGATASGTIPAGTAPVPMRAQVFAADPAAPGGFVASNGVAFDVE